jgi:hypothetical protein
MLTLRKGSPYIQIEGVTVVHGDLYSFNRLVPSHDAGLIDLRQSYEHPSTEVAILLRQAGYGLERGGYPSPRGEYDYRLVRLAPASR